MLELNDLAFQNAAVLEALDESPLGLLTKRDLARLIDRDESNLNKTLKRLSDEGLLEADPMAGLTAAGKAQLAAIRRARHGGGKRTVRGRAPLAAFVPNPANRTVTDHAVRVMADTIEAVGDVLERIKATPADATGVRMLLDGETRWRAVALLAEQGRLPEALAEGIPFEEREATEVEQILIRIVTASARTDLSPLDDARQLLALQQATGWTARDIAKKTGRSPADSDTGVRDVQSKIRVAREASPEALAQYEQDGSWDRLRDSVTAPRPAPAPEPVPEEAPAPSPPVEVGGDRSEADGDQTPATGPDPDWVLDAPWVRETDLAVTNGTSRAELRVFHHPDGRWFVSACTQDSAGGMGESYQVSAGNPAYPTRLEALKAARTRVLARHPLAAAWLRNWLDQQLGPHYVNGRDCLNASNANEARRAYGLLPRPSNSGGGKARPNPTPDTPPPTPALATRADHMAEADLSGTTFVLTAAIAELVEAVDGHLTGIRRELTEQGRSLESFEDDTAALRETLDRAVLAVEGLGLGEGEGQDPVEPFTRRLSSDAPWVPVRKSITPEHITCLHDGRRFVGGLRRHLLTRYNQTPDDYRRQWGLPADYPMVAPNHAKRQHDALKAAALRSAGQ